MRKISVSSTLTVYHDGQFWVGVCERAEGGRYGVCRVVFGAAEPTDSEILAFVCERWATLPFAYAVAPGVGPGPASASASGERPDLPALSPERHVFMPKTVTFGRHWVDDAHLPLERSSAA